MAKRVVLAYSGGLDTSVAVKWIGEEWGAEVIALAVDVGQTADDDWETIRQRAEFRELIGQQFALVVAADEHLEHDAAFRIEEHHRGRRAAHGRTLDEGDAGAALMAQMAVEGGRAGDVVIAVADLARRHRA